MKPPSVLSSLLELVAQAVLEIVGTIAHARYPRATWAVLAIVTVAVVAVLAIVLSN